MLNFFLIKNEKIKMFLCYLWVANLFMVIFTLIPNNIMHGFFYKLSFLLVIAQFFTISTFPKKD